MEMKTIGVIIMSAIAIIVCISLLVGGGGISGQVGAVTTTVGASTGNVVSTPGAVTTLIGKQATSFVAKNATVGNTFANYTIRNNVILSDGTLGSQVTWGTDPDYNLGAGAKANITYTYQPLGYVDDVAGRTIAGLIIVFCALIILVIAVVPNLQNLKILGA